MPTVILTIKETVTIGRSLHGMLSLPTLLLFLGIFAVRKIDSLFGWRIRV